MPTFGLQEAWAAISNRTYIWNYVVDFAAYVLPIPNYYVIAPNIRYFVEHGVVGLYEEGDGHGPASDLDALKAHVDVLSLISTRFAHFVSFICILYHPDGRSLFFMYSVFYIIRMVDLFLSFTLLTFARKLWCQIAPPPPYKGVPPRRCDLPSSPQWQVASRISSEN